MGREVPPLEPFRSPARRDPVGEARFGRTLRHAVEEIGPLTLAFDGICLAAGVVLASAVLIDYGADRLTRARLSPGADRT